MCFYSQLTATALKVENRFKAKLVQPERFVPVERWNGFSHPQTPVVTNERREEIDYFHWGLMPSWATDLSFRKNTLNAKIETLAEKPSFRPYLQQRCLVLVDGFFEWQWLDEKGRRKQQFHLRLPDHEPFAMAGLWNRYTDRTTGTAWDTYTIVTTEANEQMSRIHNSKRRMPFILSPDEETPWLDGRNLSLHRDTQLEALPIYDVPVLGLFDGLF